MHSTHTYLLSFESRFLRIPLCAECRVASLLNSYCSLNNRLPWLISSISLLTTSSSPARQIHLCSLIQEIRNALNLGGELISPHRTYCTSSGLLPILFDIYIVVLARIKRFYLLNNIVVLSKISNHFNAWTLSGRVLVLSSGFPECLHSRISLHSAAGESFPRYHQHGKKKQEVNVWNFFNSRQNSSRRSRPRLIRSLVAASNGGKKMG